MKKIIILILSFISFYSFSQTTKIPIYDNTGKQSGFGNGDTLNKEIKRYVNGVPSLSDTAIYVLQQSSKSFLYYDSTVNTLIKLNRELTADDWGMKGDGISNDSLAFTNYLNSAQKNIILEAGKTYIVGSHFLKAGKNLIGNGATLKQVSTAPIYSPPILYVNSNSKVENTTFIGDITKGGEWSHGIYVTPDNGNLTDTVQNVLIQNNTFRNLRGDGVYVGVFTQTQKRPQNVTIQNNKVRNVIRNGISIVAGSNITIENNNIDSVGFMTVDLESDGTEIIENITINNQNGRSIGVISTAGTIENITINNFKLNDSISNRASESYIAGNNIAGIIIRNVKNVNFINGEIKSFQGYGVEQVGTISGVSFDKVKFINVNKGSFAGTYALRSVNGAKFTDCRFQGNFRLTEYGTNFYERDTFLMAGNRLTYSGNSQFKNCYIEAGYVDDGIGGGLWENCELNMGTGTGIFRLGSYIGTPTLRNCIAYNNSNNVSIYPDANTAIKIKVENCTLNGQKVSVINGNGTATLPIIVKQSGVAGIITIPNWMRANGTEIEVINQTEATVTLTNNISGTIGTSNYYIFDTTAKFVGRDYQTLKGIKLSNLVATTTADSVTVYETASAGVLKRMSIDSFIELRHKVFFLTFTSASTVDANSPALGYDALTNGQLTIPKRLMVYANGLLHPIYHGVSAPATGGSYGGLGYWINGTVVNFVDATGATENVTNTRIDFR